MRWVIAICLSLAVSSVASADIRSAQGKLVKSTIPSKIRPVAKPWKTPLPIAGCPNGQCPPTQSRPDPLDGSDLPDDLFGGRPDPQGQKSPQSGGNTCFRFIR